MGKAMTDKLVELTWKLQQLDRDGGIMTKQKKIFAIWKAKRNMLLDIRKNGFIMSRDIIDFCNLKETAKTLSLPMEIERVITGIGDRTLDGLDQIGLLNADIPFGSGTRMEIKAKAHYEKGNKDTDKIELDWIIYDEATNSNLNTRLKAARYSNVVKALFSIYDNSPIQTYSNILAGKSYGIIYNIFVIGIEQLFMSIKEKYL